jgi:hypothetical protein
MVGVFEEPSQTSLTASIASADMGSLEVGSISKGPSKGGSRGGSKGVSRLNSAKLDAPSLAAGSLAAGSLDGGDSLSMMPLAAPWPVTYSTLPKALATSLTSLWQAVEDQSYTIGRTFFNALRDARYQQIQRRRGLHDTLSSLLLRLDTRQELFDEFATGFNAIDNDFRFDPDCCAELHLRSLELREAILTGCEVRRKEGVDLIARGSADGAVELNIHVCESEAAAFLQAEYNRFVVSLHLMFDYTKMVGGYDANKRSWNALEETLPAVLPALPTADGAPALGGMTKGSARPIDKNAKEAKKGAAKGKVEEDAPPAAYREPIPALTLPTGMMEALPVPTPIEAGEEKADKGKGAKDKDKGKDKKGTKGKDALQTEAPPSPFLAAEKAVLDLLTPWSKESYRVNRLLYDKDEVMCLLVERAVWHEVERLKQSVATVRLLVADQTAWLQSTEASLQRLLSDLVAVRFDRECASCERLIGMIGERIESAEPIHHQWLLAPDVVAVTKGVRLVPADTPPPAPVVEGYWTDRLNLAQHTLWNEWVAGVSLGGVVLEQDLEALLDRGLSPIGPMGTLTQGSGVSRHLTLPKKWRELDRGEGVRAQLLTRQPQWGVAEHTGTIFVDTTLDKCAIMDQLL